MPYVRRVPDGPLDGALVVVDTDLPIVAHCFAYRDDNGALNVTMTTDATVPAHDLVHAFRELANSIENDPRRKPAV